MTEETNVSTNTSSNSTDSTHLYDVIMRAIIRLPEKEKETLMDQLTIPQITYLLISKENMDEYVKKILDLLETLTNLLSAISKLSDNVTNCIDGVDDIVGDYNNLNADEKKEAALKLLNNGDFQKNCCEILVGDMERIAKTDVNVKAINDVFNITGWCKNLIKRGIGMNHKYEV